MNNEKGKFTAIMITVTMSVFDKAPHAMIYRDKRISDNSYKMTPSSVKRIQSLEKSKVMTYSQTVIRAGRISVIYSPA